MTQTPSHSPATAYAGRLSGSARAYLTLLRGDTAASINQLKALPDTACPACFAERILMARLLIGKGQLQDAARLLEKDLTDASGQNNPLFVLWELERGRLAERLADKSTALRHYGLVEAAWRSADPSLRWAFDSARFGRLRLAGR